MTDITGLYGTDEVPEDGVVRGTIRREDYVEDPTLFDGLGSMVAFLARERAEAADADDS